ncbi:MAG: PAS domain S-box protein, partial [Acidobacteriota bacterium]
SPLSNAPNPEFEELAQIAALICSTPLAFVAFEDESLQEWDACVGTDCLALPRSSLLSTLRPGSDLVVVHDLAADRRFDGLLACGVRFCAGAPLVVNGRVVGALAVADRIPRTLALDQSQALQSLARQVVAHVQLRQLALELERKAEELCESQQKAGLINGRYTELVDHLDAIVWRADPRTFRFTFVSRAAETLLGYEREDWLGPGFWPSIIHPDDLSVVEECSLAVEARIDHILTYRMRSREGMYRSFRDHVNVRSDELFGIMVDITELLGAESLARAGEEKYRRVIEGAPDGIGVHVAGAFVLANAQFASILGLESSEALIGQPVARFVHRDYTDLVKERLEALGRGESVPLMPEKLIRVDRTLIDVEVAAIPVPFGDVMGVQVIVRDITERLEAEKKVREAENRVRIISDASNEALWEWSYEHGMVWMNEPYRALLGPDRSHMSVDAWLERVHPQDRERVDERRRDALQRRFPMWTDEYRFLNQAGEWRSILSRCQLRFDGDGAPTRLIGAMMDVTELRASEGRRRNVEELYRVFLENSMVGVYIVHGPKIIYANPKACELFGYTLDEILEIPNVLETVAPEQRELVQKRIADRLSGATAASTYTVRCLRKDGRFFDAELMNSVVEIGGQTLIIGNFTDVTERRRAEVELQRSEERLRLLVENVNEIIYSIDAEGRLIWFNSAFERVTGFSPEEWIGRPFLDLLAPESADDALRHFSGVMEEEKTRPMQYRLRTLHGRFLEIEVSSRPVLVQDEVVGTVGVARDISERRSLERKLDQATRLSGLGQLAASIAHEFNNVLMGIQPFAEVLTRSGQSRENVLAAAGYIAQAIERGKNISLQILRFANPQPPALQPVRLLEWLNDVVAEARAVVSPYCTVELHVESDAGLMADVSQLTQVMMNLVINARDAMTRGGTITISASVDADEVQVNVKDEGGGIPPHLLQNVFDPLFTTKRTGTGLGLSIAHQIIASHGGRMVAENVAEGGAIFRVVLPARAIAAPQPELVAQSGTTHPRRVLLVEDDDAVAAGLVMLLEIEGFVVERIPDGSRAIEVYERLRPEVVILDMNLPGKSGTEVYADLRRHFGLVCVVFSTGHVDAVDVGDDPNVRLLVKPYAIERLIETIEGLLAQSTSCQSVEGN